MSRPTRRFPVLALAAAVVPVLTSACVTRTVYVVDNDPRPAPAPPPTAAEASPPDAAVANDAPIETQVGIVATTDFYEPLSTYGTWVSYPGYGMVWQPSVTVVGAGFRPYTHGHWERTEYGWTWVDHHPFGWATGHYGRWFYDGSYGWVWVPGTVWAPAWVTWRSGGGYVGWAPLPPGAAFGGVYTVYDTSWVFVSTGSFGVAYVGSYLVVGPGYTTVYASTYPIRDTYVVYGRRYYSGPSEDDVVRGGGRVVHRPAREIDRDRAVTRPPRGTAISRNEARTRGRDDGRPASGRDDDTTGIPRGRRESDEDSRREGDRDRGHGNDSDRVDEDNPGNGDWASRPGRERRGGGDRDRGDDGPPGVSRDDDRARRGSAGLPGDRGPSDRDADSREPGSRDDGSRDDGSRDDGSRSRALPERFNGADVPTRDTILPPVDDLSDRRSGPPRPDPMRADDMARPMRGMDEPRPIPAREEPAVGGTGRDVTPILPAVPPRGRPAGPSEERVTPGFSGSTRQPAPNVSRPPAAPVAPSRPAPAHPSADRRAAPERPSYSPPAAPSQPSSSSQPSGSNESSGSRKKSTSKGKPSSAPRGR